MCNFVIRWEFVNISLTSANSSDFSMSPTLSLLIQRALRQSAAFGYSGGGAPRQALAIEAEYLAQVAHGYVAHALRVGRTRSRLSAVVVVCAGHRYHLPIVRAQGGVALELVSGSAVPQHLRLVPVSVVRPVEVTIQHQFGVTRLAVYHLHCKPIAMLVLETSPDTRPDQRIRQSVL